MIGLFDDWHCAVLTPMEGSDCCQTASLRKRPIIPLPGIEDKTKRRFDITRDTRRSAHPRFKEKSALETVASVGVKKAQKGTALEEWKDRLRRR